MGRRLSIGCRRREQCTSIVVSPGSKVLSFAVEAILDHEAIRRARCKALSSLVLP